MAFAARWADPWFVRDEAGAGPVDHVALLSIAAQVAGGGVAPILAGLVSSLCEHSAMRRSCSARALLGAAFASVCLTFIWPQVTASRADFLEIEFAPGTPPFWGVPAYHYNFGPPIGGRRIFVPQIYQSPRPPAEIEKVPYRPPPPGGPGRQTICVRTCDGYYFPVAALRKASDVDAQQARCSKLCPGAASRLFVMGEKSLRMVDATPAKGGDSYAKLLVSLGKPESQETCSCQAPALDPLSPGSSVFDDRTLRHGDAIVTPTGVRIFQAGGRYPYRARDFLPLEAARGLPLDTRRALLAVDRSLRTRHRGAPMNGGWKSAAE
jgi:hypothetical protein